MNRSPGIAKKLYAVHKHPRLLIGPDNLLNIRKQIARGSGKRVMDALRKKTDG